MGLDHVATVLFVLAVLHTFCVSFFKKLAHRYPKGSIGENAFHMLGEVEAVFLFWTGVLILCMTGFLGWHDAVLKIDGLNYTEPAFVFVIMAIASTKPVVDCVDALIRLAAKCIPLPGSSGFFLSAMILAPLMGSFVTEPAAMTVGAIVLKRQFFDRGISRRFRYAILGTLFVSVSIGGTLTHFAAPPVLMVAHTWHWDMAFMARSFGYKAAIAVVLCAVGLLLLFGKELRKLPLLADSDEHGSGAAEMPAPLWVMIVHLLFLAFTVLTAHHAKVFLGSFVFFLGFCHVTQEFQERIKLRDALLVGGFLAGLVTLGSFQNWWLQPLLASLNELQLFLGCTALTAVTDNAALTFLGSQVQGLSDGMKYALVAGAVTGGGLTVIANAPNPAGYSILNSSFEEEGKEGGISPWGLLLAAALPTLIAALCFWFLPSL